MQISPFNGIFYWICELFLLDRSGISFVVLKALDADLLQEINFVDQIAECILIFFYQVSLIPVNKLIILLLICHIKLMLQFVAVEFYMSY
jgi:hypothetical protein